MKVCFPVEANQGLDSLVHGHFGSAQSFLMVDSDSAEVTEISNRDRIHEHGACNPIAGLGGQQVDAIVVGGIGGGALQKLNNAGMQVFQAQGATIAENLDLLRNNGLSAYMPGHTCGGHGHRHGCAH